MRIDLDRRLQDVDELFGDERRVLLVPQFGDDQDELVSAEPRDRVAFALSRSQPLGHLDQQLVAGGVPQRVVDRLEAIEVE